LLKSVSLAYPSGLARREGRILQRSLSMSTPFFASPSGVAFFRVAPLHQLGAVCFGVVRIL